MGRTTKCEACASPVGVDERCGVCGETPESRQFVTYLGLSVMDKCPKCGNPLQVPGPLEELLCDYCLETATPSKEYWDIITDGLEYASERPGEPSGWSRNFRTDIDCMIAAPKCPSCKAPLVAATIPTGTEADVPCPACGEKVDSYPAPDWLKSVVPKAAQIFGAERPGRARSATAATVKPITFLCPDCQGPLKITAEQERVITCEHCDADCYLPDALWRRLHPVRTRSWWFVRLADEAGAKQAAVRHGVAERRRQEELARYESIMRDIQGLQGSDDNAGELKTWFAVTSAEERNLADVAIQQAMEQDWALEPTAKAVLRLRAMLNDTDRERRLLRKLEVLISEKQGATALELLDSIKVK